MNDSLLTTNDIEEALSRAYALAVAARAGYTTAWYDFDRTGIDLLIQAAGDMRPAIGIQLKATINLASPRDGFIHYPLARRNYDELRIATQTPRLLVVLDLPKDMDGWVTITAEELVLRRRAYWMRLRGSEDRSNVSSVTVPIPEGNWFNVESLKNLMEQSRKGVIQ